MRKWVKVVISALAWLLVASLLSSCSASGEPSTSPIMSRFLSAWQKGDYQLMTKLSEGHPPKLASKTAAALRSLGARAVSLKAGNSTVESNRATVQFEEHFLIPGYGAWAVKSRLHLRLVDKHWRVIWSPAVINPAFGTDGSYSVSYIWPQRAAVLSSNGTAISPSAPRSVVIGIEGRYVKSATSLTKSLMAAGATSGEVAAALSAAQASPSSFESVLRVSWSRYEQLRASLYPVPGVFFQAEGGGGTTPPDLVGVVGTLDVITKAELKRLGPPYTATSTVGQGGIEQVYERQLAGRPKIVISVVAPGRAPRRLASLGGSPGRPVRTTIDLQAETEAATAISAAPGEAALVAIQASTGKIIAVANTSQGSDLGLDGAQPPGSTMKVITSTALIKKGLTPQSSASCPNTINVDGENFHNAGGENPVSNMLGAFTESCNTAYIGLTMANLGYSSLHKAALVYRVGNPLDIGAVAFGGSVPINTGQTDLAASAIGQARVLMSPLDLAMVAADLDSGVVRTPYIAVGAPAARAPTSKLPGNLVSYLHEMMASVVASGTAANTGLPPGTYAKTGTAEYGTGNPLPIDAWLMGFHKDIAFCMIVINSPGEGGPTDGPMVARFLKALGG
jgi:cell division protein FtsI/penicillin-binding protein 2